jgi:hypothetical protein
MMTRRSIFFRYGLIGISFLLLITGCNLISSLVDPKGDIRISPESVSMATFQEVQLKASFTTSDGATDDITGSAAWTSSDPGIVEVVGPGLIEAKALGEVAVQVKRNNISTNIIIDVTSIGSSPDPTAAPTPAPGIDILQVTTQYSMNSTFDFGVTTIGSSNFITFTILNTANDSNLILNGAPAVKVTGPNAADFLINQPTGTPPITIGPLTSTTFNIIFTPLSEGTRNARFEISSNVTGESPYIVNLTGIGGMPTIVVSGNGITTSLYDPHFSSFNSGPIIPTAPSVGTGSNRFRITSGTWSGKTILILGGGTNATAVYDPVPPAGFFSVGPVLPYNAGIGSSNFSILSGMTAVICGNSTIYRANFNPLALGFESGFPLPYTAGTGSQSFTKTNGQTVIIYEIVLSLYDVYDRGSDTFSSGTGMPAVPSMGANTFDNLNGNFVTIIGGGSINAYLFNTTTDLYNPAPINLGAPAGAGAHTFIIPPGGAYSGRIMVILGNASVNTAIYNPSNGMFTSGPSLSGVAESGANSFLINEGTFAGKVLVVHGGNSLATSIYNPATNSFSSGPPLAYPAADGALNFPGK